jgi:hypothetical protein
VTWIVVVCGLYCAPLSIQGRPPHEFTSKTACEVDLSSLLPYVPSGIHVKCVPKEP